ncbi:MAG: acyl-CoA thioesterase [Acidimicrobiia bacterium]
MHETTINVRWSELDPYHHVNHAVYMAYFESARIEALEAVGWGMKALGDRGYMILVAEASVRFRKPAGAGDTLTVQTRVVELKAATSRWRQELLRDGEVLVSAEFIGAVTDLDGRPRRMPDELRETLERRLGD